MEQKVKLDDVSQVIVKFMFEESLMRTSIDGCRWVKSDNLSKMICDNKRHRMPS